MHLRINEVTVSSARIDELGDVLTNKALPVVRAQAGSLGVLCSADRATGDCSIVSFWDSKESLDASEQAIATTRSETIDALDAKLNALIIAEVLSEVTVAPTQVGNRARVVRLTAPSGNADKLIEFYETEAVPRLQSQPGFLSSRLIRRLDDDTRFGAVSVWADGAALGASETNSSTLRDEVANKIAGTSIERVSTAEIIQVEQFA